MRQKLLRFIFSPKSFILFVFLFQNLLSFSQTPITVSGKVTEEGTGAPLAKVSVTVKGSTAGTVTNESGDFTITLSTGGVLLFSYLNNVSREVKVDNANPIIVSLASSQKNLDEVVVIGYGSRRKRDLTGAVSSITAKDIEKSTSTTPEMALQGRAAGVFVESGGGNPNSRPTIRIRGTNTFGFADPLYVVDGVPIFEGGNSSGDAQTQDLRSPVNIFTLINPQDIESMTVLKDASASAIYGVRASNGVVLITTRRGKAGRARVDYNGIAGVQNLPSPVRKLNTSQYFDLVEEAFANNPSGTIASGDANYNPASPLYKRNGATIDWERELYNRNAILTDHSVKVSGGSENITYFFSAGYNYTQSPLKANDLKRYSFAANMDARISKWLSAGINLRVSKQGTLDNTDASLVDMMSTLPFQPIYDPADPSGFAPTSDATLVQNPNYDPSLLDPGSYYQLSNYNYNYGPFTRYNAFARQALNRRTFDLLNFLGSAYFQVEPIKGLRLRGSLSGNYLFNFQKSYTDNLSYRFGQPPQNPYTSGMNQFAVGRLGERNTRNTNLMKDLTLSYSTAIGSDHNIDVVLNASEQTGLWYVADLSGQVNYRDRNLQSIDNRAPNTSGFSQVRQEDGLIGYVGRLSYRFRDKYYLDATVRRDGSSRLAPGHRYESFPAFGAGWRISQEKFFPQTTWINDLKIRGSWGRLGNFQSAGFYQYLSGVSLTPDYPLGSDQDPTGQGVPIPGAALPGFANESLTWEKTRSSSIGFDAVLFNNSVTFTAEYFDKKTFDIIQDVTPPPNTGIQYSTSINIAQVNNRGFEFQLGYNKRFGQVGFSANANLSTTRNRVLSLNLDQPFNLDGNRRVEEGKSMGYLWGHKVSGIFRTQAEIDAWEAVYYDQNAGQDPTSPTAYRYKPGDVYFMDIYGNPIGKEPFSYTKDSIINDNDRTYLGKTIPGFYYGFSVAADWKGFDVNIFFQGVGDVQRYNQTRASMEGMGSLANQWASTLDRFSSTNPNGSLPRAVAGDPARNGRFSDRWVEDASYLRLKNIQVGYNIPKALMGKIGFIQSFRVYFSGVNLLTFTKYSGLDPENDFIPPTRQYLAGITASF